MIPTTSETIETEVEVASHFHRIVERFHDGNELTHAHLVVAKMVWELPLASISSDFCDEDDFSVLRAVLNIPVRERKKVCSLLRLGLGDAKNTEFFYERLFCELFKAPWLFDIIKDLLSENVKSGKKSKKDIQYKVLEHIWRTYDFDMDGEGGFDRLMTIPGKTAVDVLLLYFSVAGGLLKERVEENGGFEEFKSLFGEVQTGQNLDIEKLLSSDNPKVDIQVDFPEAHDDTLESPTDVLSEIESLVCEIREAPSLDAAAYLKELAERYSLALSIEAEVEAAEALIAEERSRLAAKLADRAYDLFPEYVAEQFEKFDQWLNTELVRLNADSLGIISEHFSQWSELILSKENLEKALVEARVEAQAAIETRDKAKRGLAMAVLETAEVALETFVSDHAETVQAHRVAIRAFLVGKNDPEVDDSEYPKEEPPREKLDGHAPEFMQPESFGGTDSPENVFERGVVSAPKEQENADNESGNGPTALAAEDNSANVEGVSDDAVVDPSVEMADVTGSSDKEEKSRNLSALDSVIGDLMSQGHVAIAGRLAAAMTRRGLLPLISPVVLATCAGAAMSFGRFRPDVQEFSVLANNAASEEDELSQALLFVALLKPAILRNEISARAIVGNLRMKLGEGANKLQKEISELDYRFLPGLAEIERIGGRAPAERTPDLIRSLIEWRGACLTKHTSHQPSQMVLKTLVSQGDLGQIIDEIAGGDLVDVQQRVAAILARYGSENDVTERIREIEKEMGVMERARIQYHKLEWIQRNVLEGVSYLEGLAEAHEQSYAGEERHNQVAVTLDRLRQFTRLAIQTLPDNSSSDDRLAIGVIAHVRNSLNSFDAFLGGEINEFGMSLRASLARPLDLLPAGSEIHTYGAIESFTVNIVEPGDAILQEDNNVFEALSTGEVPCAMAAFQEKLEVGAFQTAKRLLNALNEKKKECEADLEERQEELTEQLQRRASDLERHLKDLSTIDLHFGDEIRIALSRISDMIEELKSGAVSLEALRGSPMEAGDQATLQHYQVQRYLDDAEALSERILKRVRAEQIERLESLLAKKPEAEHDILTLKASVYTTAPQTLDDQIAQISEGLPLTLKSKSEGTTFDEFFPNFVAAAERTSERGGTVNWPQGGTDYVGAFAGEGPGAEMLGLSSEDDRESASQLMNGWFRIAQSVVQGSPSIKGIQDLLLLIGVSRAELRGAGRVSGTKMMRYDATISIDPSGWFLPPVFGSKSGDRYKLFTCTRDVTPEQIEAELSGRNHDTPKFLLIVGRLSVERRRQLAEIFRVRRLPVLLIDETLMAFLACRPTRRLATLFDCATPFAYVQPYVTDAGRLPREIFFGRKREIEQIADMSADGSLVYGGRQLGKSALLHHVEGLYHDEDGGMIVWRRDVTSVGRPSDPAETIWARVAEGLSRYEITNNSMTQPAEVIDAIRNWLDRERHRRILVLLDETDNFMSSEARNGFPNLTRFKELMEVTQRRFKVVFAGLHNVRRMLEAPNSPLHHLGSICVGPLTRTSEDKRSARRLLLDPLLAAGYRFENEGAVNDILAYVSHYPSLVQIFMKELLTSIGPRGEGPRFVIPQVTLFRGEGYARIQAAVRDRFNLTLDLDPRFRLVAATMALMRFADDVDVINDGISVDRVRKEVTAHWPRSLQQVDEVSFRHLLEEMVELGVLSYDERAGKKLFRLRTSQIAQMLGSEDDILDVLSALGEREANVDYDASTYRRRLERRAGEVEETQALECARAPLTDDQINAILGKEIGSRFIAGLPALGLSEVPAALEAVCGSGGVWNDLRGITFMTIKPSEPALRKALDAARKTDAPTVLFVSASAETAERFASFCDNHGHVLAGSAIPIFLLDASENAERDLALKREALALRPWGHQMLRAHLDEAGAVSLDRRTMRDAMLDATGGLPEPLLALVRQLATENSSALVSPVDIKGMVQAPEITVRGDLGRLLGLLTTTDSREDYETFASLVLEGTGEELSTIIRIMELIGLVEQHDAASGIIRPSRLVEFIKAKD